MVEAVDPLAGFAPGLFVGRRIVVTGAGNGIGQAIALGCSRYGAEVILVDRNVEAVQKTCASIAPTGALAKAIFCDLGDARDMKNLASQLLLLPKIDGLINNAGLFIRSDATSALTDEWRSVMAVNLDAMHTLSSTCAKRMSAGDAIVNIASTSAFRASPGTAAYGASKAGVVGLTQALAVDLAPRGIRVNAVAPGEVATQMSSTDPALLRRIPLGRKATTAEIASVVLFLASPMASYVTGATWLADGGFMIG